MQKHSEIVILGSGLIGLSTALLLERYGLESIIMDSIPLFSKSKAVESPINPEPKITISLCFCIFFYYNIILIKISNVEKT